MPGHLLCLGFGYCARFLAHELIKTGWSVTGSSRTPEGLEAITKSGCTAVPFDPDHPLSADHFSQTTHLLISAPPNAAGDPIIAAHRNELISASANLSWVGYLSTTGVYGNREGAWVDEGSALKPTSDRARRRVEAERQWLALFHDHGLPLHIFRLAGIYGPGRNQLVSLQEKKARRIDKPGQVFSRIHVEDVAAILRASFDHPSPGSVYNMCDDEAAAPAEVVEYAASLLGVEPPPLLSLEDANLSDMAKSFYDDNKRVRNQRVKKDLGITFRYPSFREGLKRELGRL